MWLSKLLGFCRRQARPQLQHVRLVLYTRAGCHLCTDAEQVLLQAQRRWGFTLSAVDVDSDPQLRERYGEQVPVVTVAGQVRFRGGVNRVLLERIFAAEGGRPC